MRKLMLIAALSLASATAQAGVSRGLTMLASSDDATAAVQQPSVHDKATAGVIEKPQAAEATQATDTVKRTETPAYVVRPAATNTAAAAPQVNPAPPPAPKGTAQVRIEKPRHRRELTEARVIYELHRHGIYW